VFSSKVLATYHVHALKAETTGFIVAGCAALSEVGMGSRGSAWAGEWLLGVRGCTKCRSDRGVAEEGCVTSVVEDRRSVGVSM
jgi:hypothetical protein